MKIVLQRADRFFRHSEPSSDPVATVPRISLRGRKATQGQGVIEYAGALVIAAVMVSLVLVIFPNPFTEFFFQIVEQTLNMFLNYLP